MPPVSMKLILDEAIKGNYGVGACNVNNMEQIQGIMKAAKETSSQVIPSGICGGDRKKLLEISQCDFY